jgi:hypothetical protein
VRHAVIGLKVAWGVLMLVLLYLIVTSSISPLGLVFYSLVVIAVMSAAMYLRPRGGRRAAR